MKETKPVRAKRTNSREQTHSIEIDPMNYTGVYYLENDKGVKVAYRYTNRIALKSGQRHSIEIGGRNQTSFEVLPDGTIANISNLEAVMAQGRRLIFRNVSVEIDPQQYADVYFPSIFHRLADEQKYGRQSFVFVPGLKYYVELYDSGHNDEIEFLVDANGNVQGISNTEAAFARGRSLVLYNVKAVISPLTFAQNYIFAKRIRQNQNETTLVPNTKLLVYIAENAQKYVSIKSTHIAPPSLDLKDTDNVLQQFYFAIRPELSRKHWWRGENGADDDSNQPSSSRVVQPVAYIDGVVGKAFNFTGIGFIEVTNPFSLELGAVDLQFYWRGHQGPNDNQVLVGNYSTESVRGPTIVVYQPSNLSWDFGSKFNQLHYQVSENTWYHVYFTYARYGDKYAVAFYIRKERELDHKLVQSMIDIDSFSSFHANWGIGKGSEVQSNGLNGIIDEVKIFGPITPDT